MAKWWKKWNKIENELGVVKFSKFIDRDETSYYQLSISLEEDSTNIEKIKFYFTLIKHVGSSTVDVTEAYMDRLDLDLINNYLSENNLPDIELDVYTFLEIIKGD